MLTKIAYNAPAKISFLAHNTKRNYSRNYLCFFISIFLQEEVKMGAGKFDINAYKVQAKEAASTQNSGFTASSMHDEFNPTTVTTRLSKKGPFNEFRDVITVLIGLDVTGSMDIIPKSLLQGRLGNLMIDLKKTFNNPNENLQISFAGIGDAKTDEAPLQVTHFESDNRFSQQLQKIWLEGHGGGNGGESYNLLWWYAANKTHLNYVQQDKRKGILITIGDDNVHPNLTSNEIQMWLDPKYDGGDISNQVLIEAARQQYDIYHIIITDGNAYQQDYLRNAKKSQTQQTNETQQWKNMLGEENVILSKSNLVADAIADIIKKHRPLQKPGLENLTEEAWEKQNKENLTDEQWQETLSYALCPLTHAFMQNPVSLNGGKRAYEKQAIENHLREHRNDPATHKKLSAAESILKPNLNIAQLCSNYKPYFDALPEERKKQLVASTLLLYMNDIVEPKKNVEPENPNAFFAASDNEHTLKKLEKLQSNLACPITSEIMIDPVILIETGQTYERKAIEKWLEQHNTDPLTGVQLAKKDLVTNYSLKNLCDEARSEQKLKL